RPSSSSSWMCRATTLSSITRSRGPSAGWSAFCRSKDRRTRKSSRARSSPAVATDGRDDAPSRKASVAMNAVPRLRQDYSGPALLSYGFRPFFLLGALYAALAMLVWLPFFYGELTVATAFAPRDWHIHEMLFGYLAAVITGFLLTAVPNWTGRLPLQGFPLLVLVVVWVAGRVAVTFSAFTGELAAAVIDACFLFLVAAAVAREIVAGRNWRNLKVLLPLIILGIGNIIFHIEAHVPGHAGYSIRFGIAAVVLLIMLIGGRVIPS